MSAASKHIRLCTENTHTTHRQVTQALPRTQEAASPTATAEGAYTCLQNVVAMLQLHQGMKHALACVVSTVGDSYNSSVTLQLIASRNQNLAAGMLQGVSNVLQHGWQLLLQHTVCLGATSL